MAHEAQKKWCMAIRNYLPFHFIGKRVLDCGSMDINGNNRYLFESCDYTGLDVVPGPNVDIVQPIHEHKGSYETIISTEAFEHDRYWMLSLQNIVKMLLPGGMFLFTCATIGRREHGTKRTNPKDSGTSDLPGWQNYYRNLAEDDIRVAINVDNIFAHHKFDIQGTDLRFYGIKKA